MSELRKKVEVLAPAGSFDIMTAVINAGADAVYLGGDCFGARAFAGNLNQEELLRAIDFAHIHDRKIYLTVNTLLKENELSNQLVSYLKPFYKAGLDAVIVQDLGVFKVIHENFPDMAIHASTQMAITGSDGAEILEKMGATRIVTARELNCSELKVIHDRCNVEIESFVHGALCYCYSGQCLLSSMNGGRSGNRGRCAQPCRMAYDVYDEKGQLLKQPRGKFCLSPKDMCALDILPDVIDAGVYSLKIEGRMKNVTYAAGVTAIYRKYVDMYLEKGRKGYRVDESDINDLMDLYNRGAFTTGYYNSAKGKDMMSLSRPNHMGTKALEVVSNISGKVKFKALEQINPQDVFEIDMDNSFSSGAEYQTGQTFEVNLPKRYRLNKGTQLFRTRNGKLVKAIEREFVAQSLKKTIDMACFATVGENLRLILTDSVTGVTAYVEGDIVQEALKQPMSKEKIEAQLLKTGDTQFSVGNINIETQGNVFIPVGQLNEIRRNAFSQLENNIISQYHREFNALDDELEFIDRYSRDENLMNNGSIAEKYNCSNSENRYKKSILVSNIQQMEEVYNSQDICDIYFDFSLFKDNLTVIKNEIVKCHKNGKRTVLVLPHVTTQKHTGKINKLIISAVTDGERENSAVDAVMVRNIQQIGIFAELCRSEAYKGTRKVITDASLYIWNTKSMKQLYDMVCMQKLELVKITLPYEQTAQELMQLNVADFPVDVELVVYTKIPLMISEQCVRKTEGLCDHSNNRVVLQDKRRQKYEVKSVCEYCYSVMYNWKPFNISDMENEIMKIFPDYIRYELIDENCRFCSISEKNTETSDAVRGHFVLEVE